MVLYERLKAQKATRYQRYIGVRAAGVTEVSPKAKGAVELRLAEHPPHVPHQRDLGDRDHFAHPRRADGRVRGRRAAAEGGARLRQLPAGKAAGPARGYLVRVGVRARARARVRARVRVAQRAATLATRAALRASSSSAGQSSRRPQLTCSNALIRARGRVRVRVRVGLGLELGLGRAATPWAAS